MLSILSLKHKRQDHYSKVKYHHCNYDQSAHYYLRLIINSIKVNKGSEKASCDQKNFFPILKNAFKQRQGNQAKNHSQRDDYTKPNYGKAYLYQNVKHTLMYISYLISKPILFNAFRSA